MALVSSGSDELPLLGTAVSPGWAPERERCCLQLPAYQHESGSATYLGAPPATEALCAGVDSGCESDGVPDSAYSTVTSCTSDIIRMQLDSQIAESAEPPPLPSPPPPPPPPESVPRTSTEDCIQVDLASDGRTRSWSLKVPVRPAAEQPYPGCRPDDQEPELSMALRHSQSEPSLAASASTASMPICRICHMPDDERGRQLITPCRCAGTMQFIHTACLLHWIEVSSRHAKRPPHCELCQYQYHRHKRFRVGRWIVPAVSCRDRLLHGLFLLSVVIMITSSIVTIFCFKQDSGKRRLLYDEAELTPNETVTLVCGILFFVAFFVGMYSEIKAKHSMYRLIMRMFYLNQQWLIDQYDRSKDERYRNSPTATFSV